MAETSLIQCAAGTYSLVAEDSTNVILRNRISAICRLVVAREKPDPGHTQYIRLKNEDFPFRLSGLNTSDKVWLNPERDTQIETVTLDASGELLDDSTMVAGGGITSGNAGQWSELFAANAGRVGAILQSKAATGSLFLLMHDDGLPADGSQIGEIEIPQRPSYYLFDFQPKRRYVIRGENASMAYTLNWW